ncbi:MAG TPA: fumarate hydratase [Rhodospirillales bacterium]|jgi:fumarate hydratase class I|nr:fumarate hydratase [Rhodospirillales bacterium]
MSDKNYFPMIPFIDDTTKYRLITTDYIETMEFSGREILKIDPEGISVLTAKGFSDTSHLLRTQHLEQLRKILDDPEASDNDRFVALDLLKNANIASGRILPMCQDTGTAIIIGKKGEQAWVDGNSEAAISEGVRRTYETDNLRFSQLAPISMYKEVNTGDNLPAQIEIYADQGANYKFLFIAKGGGSANKTMLYQQTRAVLNPESLMQFLDQEIRGIGTAACPPYHLAIVIGGTSAEFNLKMVKYASTHYLDNLPTRGNKHGQIFRDVELEDQIHKLTQDIGVGAQFGGKYFCHDVRVIRLPRHGASCPIGIGVSCSADRQVSGKITKEGIFLEELDTNPARFLPEITDDHLDDNVVNLDLNQSMDTIRSELSKYPIKTRLSLTGTIIVARDIAHAKLKECIDNGIGLPNYIKDHAIYYAGPAKTPEGMASGSFGPTTAGRMDSYVDLFQANGGSMVMLAKGNRSQSVTDACKKHGGFYLGSIGGPAARLAQDCIKKIEIIEYEELGMEAIWKIEVENFPAFIVVDDKGNDFFDEFKAQ